MLPKTNLPLIPKPPLWRSLPGHITQPPTPPTPGRSRLPETACLFLQARAIRKVVPTLLLQTQPKIRLGFLAAASLWLTPNVLSTRTLSLLTSAAAEHIPPQSVLGQLGFRQKGNSLRFFPLLNFSPPTCCNEVANPSQVQTFVSIPDSLRKTLTLPLPYKLLKLMALHLIT